jgi:hypothetical protein
MDDLHRISCVVCRGARVTHSPSAAGGRTQPRCIGTMVSHNTMRIGFMVCHRVARPEAPELQQSEATVAAMPSSPSRLGAR